MRFDADLARTLLLKLESDLQNYLDEVSFGSAENYQEFYHVKKLIEAGFLIGSDSPSEDVAHDYINVLEITYEGHKFVDTIRDDKIWAKTKQGGLKLKAFSLEIAQLLAEGFIKTQAKKLTGVDFD